MAHRGFRGQIDPSLQARVRDLIRQNDDDDTEAGPQATISHEDPRTLRGRYHDDKVWGDAYVVNYTSPAVPVGVILKPPAELVRITLRPARVVTLMLIVTLKGTGWITDTATWSVGANVALGLGRASESFNAVTSIAGPFPFGFGGFQFIWPPTGKITNPQLDPLVFTARNMYVLPEIGGTPTNGAADYSVRFAAFACPYYNHPEDEG